MQCLNVKKQYMNFRIKNTLSLCDLSRTKLEDNLILYIFRNHGGPCFHLTLGKNKSTKIWSKNNNNTFEPTNQCNKSNMNPNSKNIEKLWIRIHGFANTFQPIFNWIQHKTRYLMFKPINFVYMWNIHWIWCLQHLGTRACLPQSPSNNR